jgi:adenylate cyclase
MGRSDSVFMDDLIGPQSSWDELLAAVANPYLFHTGLMVRDVVVLLSGAAILAVAMQRVHGLVRRQVQAERQRASLARYFSPNLVDELASREAVFPAERRQPVGVLFVDIVGFTAFCEANPPGAVIALLREFQRRVEGPVFTHGGTLDKFIGDAVMATFGTPEAGTHDATNTLLCARAVLHAMQAWSEERAAGGATPVRVGIGAHYGPCVVGDVGGERRLEFTVIGDTVNVASRLEELTRALDTPLLVSDELVAAARAEGEDEPGAGLTALPPAEIRGRAGPMALWTLGRGQTP